LECEIDQAMTTHPRPTAAAFSTVDLVELRLLRDRLRKESLRLRTSERFGYDLATDDTRQAQRWLALVERILRDAEQ
jgi:hypothetical protein